MAGETQMMNVLNGMERVNSVKEIGALGMIEKERVNGKEDLKSDVTGIEERKNKESLAQLEEIQVKSAPGAAVVNPAIEVKPETKAEGTEDIKDVKDPESEAKRNLNAYLERTATERLADMERLAERKRQAKIRRREELDRVARLQRILALVRAPELDSVAKINQVADLAQVEMTATKELDVVIDTNPMIKMIEMGKVEEVNEVKEESEELKALAKQEAVEQVDLMVKKKIIKPEGIAKLERMSKSERILEIDRLSNLELEAEAKRNAKVERKAELERVAELKRVAKMKRLTEIDLKAEMEEAEKERLAEEKRQEKIRRREEYERVAKLQRVLAMVLASESDQAVKAQAVNLERVREMNRKDELKLLEELGIIPKEKITETRSGKGILVEGKKLGASVAKDTDIKPVIDVKPVTEVKQEDVNLMKGAKQVTMVNQLPEVKKRFTDVDVETRASVEQLTEMESDTIINMLAKAERGAKTKRATIMDDKAKADSETKNKEEPAANLRHAIPMVAEIKRTKDREELNMLEELGIVSKVQITQTQSGISKEEKQAVVKLEEDVNLVKVTTPTEAEQKMKTVVEEEKVLNVEQLKLQNETKKEITVKAEKEENIKRAADMEHKAKADREARSKRKEELVRVANLQRVVAVVHNDEFGHMPEMEKNNLEQIVEKKRIDDMKVLEELGLVSKELEVQQSVTNSEAEVKNNDFTEIKVKDANFGGDIKGATEIGPIQKELSVQVESLPAGVINMGQMSENERITVNQDVARRLTELRVAQMKQVAVLGREMNMIAIGEQDKQHEEFNHFTESELGHTEVEEKGVETLKPLAKSRLPEVKQEVKVAKAKEVKESKPADFVLLEVKQKGVESVVGLEREELKQVPRRVEEIKRETGFETMELKRLIDMKYVGIAQVRGRDCEWDGQMMYVGKV